MNLEVFKNEELDISIRSELIDGEPWFVAKDISDVLGYSDAQALTRRLDSDEKSNLRDLLKTDTGQNLRELGLRYDTLLVSESGMYSAILWSQKSEAKPFRKWVTSEVLPSIRETGSYAVEMTSAEMILAQAHRMVNNERRIATLEREKKNSTKKIDVLEDKVEAITTAIDYFTIIGWASYRCVKNIPLDTAMRMGKQASAHCKHYGIETGDTPDPRFGRVNTYPIEVLDALFA